MIGTVDEALSERMFYNLMLRIGAIGKYQYVSLFIWATVFMISASIGFFNPFLFYQAPYTCSGLTQNECFDLVCSLPIQLRGKYINREHQTMLDMFGDFRCQNSNLGKHLQSIIYVAGLIGIILGAFLNTCIRKKLLLEIVLFLTILSLSLALYVKNLSVVTALLCVAYLCSTIINDIIPCFFIQTVLQEVSGHHLKVMFISFNIGVIANGILFKYLQWKQVFLFYLIIPLTIMFLAILFYIKETPFDLVTNFSAEKAVEDLHWIAIQNDKADSHGITVEEIKVMRHEYDESMKKKQQLHFTVLDLFKFQSLRMVTIYICVFHFFICYNFSTPMLALDQFASDIYSNDVVFGCGTLAAAVVNYFMSNDLPRKKIVYVTTIINFFFIIPMYLASKCTESCKTIALIQTLSVFLFRFTVDFAYQTLYIIQNQIFPTQVRSLGVLLSAVIGNSTTMFIPIMSAFNQQHTYILPLTLFLSGLIVLGATSQLPETLGVSPPQIISQLQYGKSQNDKQ